MKAIELIGMGFEKLYRNTQSEAKCKAIDVKIMFYFHAIKLISTRKAYALRLLLKVRVLELESGLLQFA